MNDAQREMTLEEVANLWGEHHRAAKEYLRIAHAVRMLDHCSWWEFLRKRHIKKVLVDTIRDIDNAR